MKKRLLFIAIPITALMISGCQKKIPSPDENGNAGGASSSVTTTEVTGGIDTNGKYTGSDGVSASGIKLIYFATDKYSLDSDQIHRLISDMPKIKNLAATGKIRIEGNCDEFGTDEYNHALGLKRAKAVKQILLSNGIPASSINIVSYGESNPVCTGSTPACHAKNRRAEINAL